MADSDLFQLAFNIESKHTIESCSALLANIYNPIFSLAMCPSNVSLSSLSNSTLSSAPVHSSSTNSISSLSAFSDDDINSSAIASMTVIPETSSIDGGLQRALVIFPPCKQVDDDDEQAEHPNHNTHARHERITLSSVAGSSNARNGTCTFQNWMESYRKQPHRLLETSRRRRARYSRDQHRNARHRKREHSTNTLKTVKRNKHKKYRMQLSTLVSMLPSNPDYVRRTLRSNNAAHRAACIVIKTPDRIQSIQQQIIQLQNEQEAVLLREQLQWKLRSWREFKSLWRHWTLDHLYAFLARINGCCFVHYIVDFQLFLLAWMDVCSADERACMPRFSGGVFDGSMIPQLVHCDLARFGVSSKTDRRRILTRLRALCRE